MKDKTFFWNISPTLLICGNTLTTPSSSLFGAPNLSSSFASRPLAEAADWLSCDWPEVPLWHRLSSTQFCCIACGWTLDGVAAAGEVFVVRVFVFLFFFFTLHCNFMDEYVTSHVQKQRKGAFYSPTFLLCVSAQRFYMRAVIQKYYSLPVEHSRV